VSFGGEPWRLRDSGVTGRLAESHIAHFVIRTPLTGAVNEPVTLEEFKAPCAAIPGIGPRAMGYGEHL
jgi:hypothetical protein